SFHLEMGLPVWRYEIGGLLLEKRLFLPYQQNTVHICYKVLGCEKPVRLELRPAINYRPQEAAVESMFVDPSEYVFSVHDDYFVLNGKDFPPLYLKMHGSHSTFTIDRRRRNDIFFRLEAARGYSSVGEFWSPGSFGL